MIFLFSKFGDFSLDFYLDFGGFWLEKGHEMVYCVVITPEIPVYSNENAVTVKGSEKIILKIRKSQVYLQNTISKISKKRNLTEYRVSLPFIYESINTNIMLRFLH